MTSGLAWIVVGGMLKTGDRIRMRSESLRRPTLRALTASLLALACGEAPYDVLITGGLVIDGTGAPGVHEDLAIRGDRIAARGRLDAARAVRTIDASGRVVAPGFVDLLGHSGIDLLVDPSAESKIRQGITTEITGEGRSVAPQNARTRSEYDVFAERQGIRVDWDDFEGYFATLAERGTTLNLGSYVGATQLRKLVIGRADRPASAAELVRMERLVREAMEQGAFGLSSALVYAPGAYATKQELIVLAREAAAHGGLYATHLRGEGGRIFAALDEAFAIARAAGAPTEIFHLKAAGPDMRGRMEEITGRIEAAQAEGLDVTADVYPYTAAYTSLSATLPPWVHAGGAAASLKRLRDPQTRERVLAQIDRRGDDWENFYRLAGGAEGILISEVTHSKLLRYRGKRLSDVAESWDLDPREALLELLAMDQLNTSAVFFVTEEADLERALTRPWVHIATDARALRTDGPLHAPSLHPRVYGTYPRVLGRYVRDRALLPLEEAIRKMTSAPARRVGLRERGELLPGHYADVVVFDPEIVGDLATYAQPDRYPTGIADVLVNGELVLADGLTTEARPGRALRGPGLRQSGEAVPGADDRVTPSCANEDVPTDGSTWVVVAHPEDATLGFAGPIFEATRAGRPLRVVIVTDGEDDCAACDLWKRGEVASPKSGPGCTARELSVFGHLRRREALAALELLGVAAGDVTFLGHTAGTLRSSWAEPGEAPRLPLCLRARSDRERERDASGERLLRELDTLARDIENDALVLTTHPYDGDPDHGATYEFVRETLTTAALEPEVYVTVLRDNRDEPCTYPNPPASHCEPPSLPEIASSPDVLSVRRENRYAPNSGWAAPADVDYGTPLAFCLADELYRGPDALKRRALERYETHIGLRQRRGQPLPRQFRGWADFSGRLLAFVHRNELLYRDEGSFLRGDTRRDGS
jgi:dihydroorotase/N-acyl-D-amino-acid deacylase